VAAFFTFGATAGIAVAAGEVAAICQEISVAINLVTTVLDTVNSGVLQPCVLLFRALHSFTSQADPREVEAAGSEISTAAANSGAALGAFIGGKAAQVGGRPRPSVEEGPPPPHREAPDTPPPASGDGPVVRFQEPPAGAAHAEGGPAPAADVAAPPPAADVAAPAARAEPQQLTLPGTDVPAGPRPAPGPVPQGPHPITPDVEIRGRDFDVRLRDPTSTAPAAAGEIGPHGQHGARGPDLISEHIIPGAQMRDVSVDPARGAPDWQRSTPAGNEGRDYRRATTMVEHAAVSARKTALDNPATTALQQQGGPRNMVEDYLLPSLQRHQQAVDDAIAAGEITPAQATDPVHRALAAQAEMWSLSEVGGSAQARAAGAGGMPRRADRLRAEEARRVRARLASEHIEDIDWAATFPDPNRLAPPGTQLALPGMEHLAPRPAGPVAEQLSFPGMDRPTAPPGQLSLPFEGPPRTPPTPSTPPTAPAGRAALPPAEPAVTPMPPVTTIPATRGAPEATTSGTAMPLAATAGAARTAVAAEAAAGPEAGPAEPTLGSRAREVGALFLPQVFGGGGEPQTYEQRLAAHRARFTEDNQPAEGVERVNPSYAPPPATPAQIVAMQNEILGLLDARARAEQEAQLQSERAAVCEENQDPIQQTIDDTAAGISAVQAHDAAVARRTQLNQEQQQRQTESQGLVAGYPSQATGLLVINAPLAAWEGFTSLASHLPGDAGDKFLEMNQEAQRMQQAFGQMGAEMLGIETQGPARQQELQGDQGRLEETAQQAQASGDGMQQASEGAAGLQEANDAALDEASELETQATDQAEELGASADERTEQADTLAEQLRIWAIAHRAARQQAIDATVARLESEGRTVLSSPAP
jgi:hypothetical protein